MVHSTNITKIWSFLGFTGYYQQFIPKLAQIAWSLHELTSDENTDKKASIIWDNRCQWAFDTLKCLSTTVPILAYADFLKPFELHTNAYGSGLRAILYQTCNYGMDAIISYASRSLIKAEMHYLAHKLEFLTLTWAVVKKFHKYIYGSNLTCTSTTHWHVLIKVKLDAKSHQWMASLANYNFQLHYRAGKANINDDVLLRVSSPRCETNVAETYQLVTTAAVWTMQEATCKGFISPIGACSCDVHVLDSVEDSWQVCYLYDHQRLATGPANQSHPKRGDHKESGWDLGLMPTQVNWPSKTQTAP